MVNKIKPMSRVKYNRSTNEDQSRHEKKVIAGGKIPMYQIGDYIVNKTVYDYAKQIIG